MKTRLIVYTAIAGFWATLGLLGALASRAAPDTPPSAAAKATDANTAAEAKIDAARTAKHATPEDCWIRVGTGVYDISRYIPEHPTAPRVVSEYCGKNATWAFETKARGRPHSTYAYRMLEGYRVGASAD